MKRIVFSTLFFAISLLCIAQDWTKDITKEFRKQPNVAIVIDLSNTTIMDVSLENYPKYFSGKYSSNEAYAELIIQRFKNRFKEGFYKTVKKEEVDTSAARFVVVYTFKSISENGGFRGYYHVESGNIKSKSIEFRCEDGKWNNFETLLMENSEKYWRKITKDYFMDMDGNPYKDKLY